MNKTNLICSLTFAATCAMGVLPAMAGRPKVTQLSLDEPSIFVTVSDNGKWGVTETRPDHEGGKIVNMDDFSYVTLTMTQEGGGYGKPSDVSDDGNIAVGTWCGKPAYWTRSDGQWHELEIDKLKYGSGSVNAMTPDGKYAVGSFAVDMMHETPAVWDLTTGKSLPVEGLPVSDMLGEDRGEMTFTAITPDGRFTIGKMDWAYGGNGMTFIYDRVNETYDLVVFDETPDGKVSRYENAVGVDDLIFSPNGKIVAGSLFIFEEIPGQFIGNEYTVPFTYNPETREINVFNDSSDQNMLLCNVDNNGILYGGGESYMGGPLRNFYVHNGRYWYELGQIMSQMYNIDLTTMSDLGITGTPSGVSGDGRVITSFIDPQTGEGFVIHMDEDWKDICENVNLMGTFAVSPAPGTGMASVYEVTLSFDRMIQLVGEASDIELRDASGNAVRYAMGASISSNRAVISFRRYALNDGERYTVHIPAGTFAMAKDATATNADIDIVYTGIASTPLAPKQVVPADGSSIPYINANVYTVQLGFPSMIALTETASAGLYSAEDNTQIASLNLTADQNVLIVNSLSEVPLTKGASYKVIIAAGSITDLSGAAATANEEIVLNYTGSYQTADNGPMLFSEDFNNGLGNKFLFYEGDHNQPSQTAAKWGFGADDYPWWIARESEDVYDYCAVSHSMYRPAGTSDDWMVVPRLLIPDNNTRLTFKAQSYKDAGDVLNVYAIPSNEVHASLSDETIKRFKADRKLLLSRELKPGASEEGLAGDWAEYEVDLGEYADQYIYIAFVNENTDKSAIFVDDIQVLHEMRFSVALDNKTTVVNEKSMNVSGSISVGSAEADYNSATIELLDGDNNIIDTFSRDNISVTKENPLDFSFTKAATLKPGKYNNLIIRATMHDRTSGENEVSSTLFTIADLAFETTKRAVLEEYTGQECGNCPMGIRAVELISEQFGDRFIPVVVRTYNGDPQSPVNSTYADDLGIAALGAPSGLVNRRYAGYPMSRGDNEELKLAGGSIENGLWYDFVVAELDERSPFDIDAKAGYDKDANKVVIDAEVNYAIDTDNASINLFGVLLENNVLCVQSNYFSSSTDPLIGEWGLGGEYGQETTVYMYNHLARNVSNNNLVGTPGQLPMSFIAEEPVNGKLEIIVPAKVDPEKILDNCDVVVMAYDNITRFVTNACKVPVSYITGVDNVLAEDNGLAIAADGTDVTVTANGAVTAEAYDLAGRMIARGEGTDALTLSLEGYSGVAVIRAISADAQATAKLVIR